jgi:hypothetical protein
MNGCPGDIIGFEFALECFQDQFTDYNKTPIIAACDKKDQWPVILA